MRGRIVPSRRELETKVRALETELAEQKAEMWVHPAGESCMDAERRAEKAEAELTYRRSYDAGDFSSFQKVLGKWRARAEKAEAELAEASRIMAKRFPGVGLQALILRAEKAEANFRRTAEALRIEMAEVERLRMSIKRLDR